MKFFRQQDWWKRIPTVGGPRGEVRLKDPGGFTVFDNALSGVIFAPLRPTRVPGAGVPQLR